MVIRMAILSTSALVAKDGYFRVSVVMHASAPVVAKDMRTDGHYNFPNVCSKFLIGT